MAATESDDRRLRLTAGLLDVAQLGHAQWLFGNVYEAVVKIPELLASEATAQGVDGRRSVLGRGSPVRYYLAAALPTAAGVAALINSRTAPDVRRWVAISGGCWVAGAAVTGYLVRNVNLKLFFTAHPPPVTEREKLIRVWHWLNILRIGAAAGALFAAHRAQRVAMVGTVGAGAQPH